MDSVLAYRKNPQPIGSRQPCLVNCEELRRLRHWSCFVRREKVNHSFQVDIFLALYIELQDIYDEK